MRSLAALDDRPNGSAAPDRSRRRGAHLVDPSIDALPGGPAARTLRARPWARLDDDRPRRAPAPGGRRPRGALPQADPGPRAEYDEAPTPLRADAEELRGGRYWDRTSDLFRVKEARYPCANRPRWVRDSNPCIRLCRPLPRLSANPPCSHRNRVGVRIQRADDGTRTRDPHLGKVMLYQLSHIRVRTACAAGVPPAIPSGDQDDRGRYWDRTSDLFRVREARSRCANRPSG